jgi:ribosome-binding factor A
LALSGVTIEDQSNVQDDDVNDGTSASVTKDLNLARVSIDSINPRIQNRMETLTHKARVSRSKSSENRGSIKPTIGSDATGSSDQYH